MATPPKTLGERKFKDRCIVDAPSVDEYRARQAELVAEGVTDYPLMLECLGLKGRALEVAVQERLPYEDATFDIASISFGIRNVADPRKGISEMARVVRSGGRVIVLEFGQPRSRAFRALYDFYRRRVLPGVGGMVTGEPGAYEYLERSAGRFPSGEEFLRVMRESADFRSVSQAALTTAP
jgi:demethylmenaquinone methyltransferase/2-methoxy-6-polyprenyl-1,4-benzoquinol methylase